ncbi:Hypothetical protein POVN_LOCUS477 [uncultured virus]|nr:Hypothetical protein POVN_LOCUS477 [uncultured virus]
MSTRVLSPLPLAWNRLVSELLHRQATYSDLDLDDIDYGTQVIVEAMGALDPEHLYKNLVYLDAASRIGRFAMSYRDQLTKAIRARDAKAVAEVLAAASSLEYDDNPYLTGTDKLNTQRELKKEMIAFNALIDQVTRLKEVPQKLLTSDTYKKCREDVCVWYMPPDGVAAGSSRDRVLLLDKSADSMVWVADQSGTQIAYTAWCFKLPELIKIIVADGNNPYTGRPFTARVSNMLRARYSLESLLVRRYLEAVGILSPPSATLNSSELVRLEQKPLPLPVPSPKRIADSTATTVGETLPLPLPVES